VCLAASAQTLPSPEQLIRTAVAVHAAQQDWKFTYREDYESFQTDRKWQRVPPAYPFPNQKVTFDVVIVQGEPFYKMVLLDGKPLDAQAQERADQSLERAFDAHRGQPLTTPTGTWHYNARVIGIELLEQYFETKLAGEETVLGRKAWRLEAVPRRDRRLDYKKGEPVVTRVVIWLDQQEGAEIRQTTTYEASDPGRRSETEITEEYSKIGEAWLLNNARSRNDAKPGLTQHVYSETDIRRYDYKRFTVDSTIVTP
jgi:hypothetical protein